MSVLVVRAYNVEFGDAVLVSIPEVAESGDEIIRHLLIDVGNLLPNTKEPLLAAVRDIAARTSGTVDLYVMTHEHMDHVKGLLTAHKAGVPLTARHAWLTASAAPDYYESHPDAAKQRSLHAQMLLSVTGQKRIDDPWLDMMIDNNSLLLPETRMGISTAESVDHLRSLAPEANTHYVDRESVLEGTHPFTEATIRLLAPEADTSDYYGRLPPRLALSHSSAASASAPDPPPSSAGEIAVPHPPVGIDAGAFFDLVSARHGLTRHAVLEIDRAANNTSVVLEIEWRGWRLLFGGDAEERSWQTILDRTELRPVHLVKISHHGSHNGTVPELLDTVLPLASPDERPRYAVVSTHEGDWDSVPDQATLEMYSGRAELHDTRTAAPGTAVEIRLPG